jgi:membrane associated rhomboid family serine protease
MARTENESNGLAGRGRELLRNAGVVLLLTAVLWILEAADQVLLDGALDEYGVRPRSVEGLRGLILAPLLHAGFGHLASNTVPLLVLGWFVMLRGRWRFLLVSLGVTILGGAGTWLIGASDSVHIGASGMIFGYLGFLLGSGIFERSLKAILLALAAGLLYGGLIFGVLPGNEGISWEGHLFGFAGGVLLARLMSGRTEG